MSDSLRQIEGVGSVSRRPWSQFWPGLLLLAGLAGVVLFLALVVVPSAGASGGCGGG
jgi:hypothetical protein